MRSDPHLRDPWASFLSDLDGQLAHQTELHCLGGFVVSELYGFMRPTADIDVLEVTKGTDPAKLARLAGKGSELHSRHKLYLDVVAVATVPGHYESRLRDLAAGQFRKLRLRAFEPHDLVLAKLERNSDRDREDLRRLAENPGLDPQLLRERYDTELPTRARTPAV